MAADVTERYGRQRFVEALHAALMGPGVPPEPPSRAEETLPPRPSRGHLTRLPAPQAGRDAETSPTESHGRHAVSLRRMTLEEPERWPGPVAVGREKVGRARRALCRMKGDAEPGRLFRWSMSRCRRRSRRSFLPSEARRRSPPSPWRAGTSPDGRPATRTRQLRAMGSPRVRGALSDPVARR